MIVFRRLYSSAFLFVWLFSLLSVQVAAATFENINQFAIDFDGDGIDDLVVFRPSSGQWFVLGSQIGYRVIQWGAPGDIPVPANFEGTGAANLAVFRPETGTWFIRNRNGTTRQVSFGVNGDLPIPADFTGDGRADLALFRPAQNEGENNTFIIRPSNGGADQSITFGVAGDLPIPADFDGDGRADVAVFRPAGAGRPNNVFIYHGSSVGTVEVAFGVAGDLPVPMDFDGNGSVDIAIFRPSTGLWAGFSTTSGSWSRQWGGQGDIPVPGRYNQPDRSEIAVFRAGQWFINQPDASLRATLGHPVRSRPPFVWGEPGDIPVPMDYSGDGQVNKAVFRPRTGQWFVLQADGRTTSTQFGGPGMIPLPGLWDNNNTVDIAVFNPETSQWSVSFNFANQSSVTFGASTDIPVPGDYNGDGFRQFAVFRNGTWFILQPNGATRQVNWGIPGDIPVPADYNGDGRTDIAVFRPSTGTWHILIQGSPSQTIQFGAPGDIPVPFDFDGDGSAEIAIFRPSTGTWYRPGHAPFQFGGPGDIPVPGDYDGDGIVDFAVYRQGEWWVRLSSTGQLLAGTGPIAFGASTDIPVGRGITSVTFTPPTPPLDELIGPRGPGGGFLWKPVSEANRNLVVLLPSSLTDGFRETFLADADGNFIERGVFSGVHNGGREHYRFSRPGAAYGRDLFVVGQDRNGNRVHWPISNGGSRIEF